MLDYLLDRLAAAGIESGILVTNHRFFPDFQRWASGESHAVALKLLDDQTEANETRLGAIGDLRFALETADVQNDFLVVNGDNLFTFALDPVLGTFRQRGNTIVLYDVGLPEVARLMGHAACDETGRVIDFVEKPEQPPGTLTSIGIYLYQQAVRDLVNQYLAEGHSPDRTGDFVRWLHQQVPIYAHAISGDSGVWFDIGSWDQYQEANRAFGGEPLLAPQS